MKNCVVFAAKALTVLVFGIIAGVLLLNLVFLLPDSSIQKHAKEAVLVMAQEGVHPAIVSGSNAVLDNYTDSLMLLSAMYDGSESTMMKSMQVYTDSVEGATNPVDSLLRHDQSTITGRSGYPRYWHGYLVYLRPLLCILSYPSIRMANRFFQLFLLALLLLLLVQKKRSLWVLPVIGLVISLAPVTISYSLQYSSVYDIMLIAMILIVWRSDRWEYKQAILFFLIVGMLTSYFDLLTFPILTLGTPAALYFAMKSHKKPLLNLVGLSVSWGVGYLGMWAGKWLVATLVIHENVFLNAYNQIRFRTSTSQNGYAFTIGEVLFRNWKTYFASPVVTIVWLGCLALFIFSVNKYGTVLLKECIPLFVIALMPFAWYILAQNHSFIHYFFTYRNCSIAVFAFMCIVFKYIETYFDWDQVKRLVKSNVKSTDVSE